MDTSVKRSGIPCSPASFKHEAVGLNKKLALFLVIWLECLWVSKVCSNKKKARKTFLIPEVVRKFMSMYIGEIFHWSAKIRYQYCDWMYNFSITFHIEMVLHSCKGQYTGSKKNIFSEANPLNIAVYKWKKIP